MLPTNAGVVSSSLDANPTNPNFTNTSMAQISLVKNERGL